MCSRFECYFAIIFLLKAAISVLFLCSENLPTAGDSFISKQARIILIKKKKQYFVLEDPTNTRGPSHVPSLYDKFISDNIAK